MKCNNSKCMKAVLGNKNIFKGTCYCKNEVCVYARAGIGQDTFMSFNFKHTGNGKRIKSNALPIRCNLSEAQKDLDDWAEKKGLNKCIINTILSKEASNEKRT